ncbi:hypothetical protein TSAR_015442 [Trichomalopsis sarcophagae]|uniref:Uncharacterized protein n=1 Tax=Trichomalopsis sarcophagae TaxID=543379 RepID=A0A232FD78_9HYME|nr:hypothetical protein TSAR_015442 [Trichomalopsis sarcophagae]
MARSERTRRKQHRRRQLRNTATVEPPVVVEDEPLGLWRHVGWADAFVLLIASPLMINICTGAFVLGLCYFLGPTIRQDEPKSCCES